ncbi:DUF3566 domain-containing protein [Mycolicibacterium mengxianglii]|uniref:DUF3566 domain-containing protein n=1 Tax=Mycolicibacterium mengxianglii TaxID=2736649 RepID=UPI0018D0A7AC|nr:DUF3566 domain-containing protein [Mycolicibacterium mengxianglii]
MSSPKEPGHNGSGDGAAPGSGNGHAGDRAGAASRPAPPPARVSEQGPPTARINDGGDVPPWQRGAGRTQQSGPRPPLDPTRAPEQQRPSVPAPTQENRPNRYIAGTAVQAPVEADPAARNKEYASELPDLSGPAPRTGQQRNQAADTGAQARPGSGRVQVGNRGKGGPLRASMQIRRVDPWSALKVSLLLSIALFFVWMIAVAILYLVLGGMGVWTKLNSNVGDLLTSTSGSGGELVSSGTIFGGALMIGLLNIVLLTAMATVGAFIYNLTTDIVGGVEVTLADRD